MLPVRTEDVDTSDAPMTNVSMPLPAVMVLPLPILTVSLPLPTVTLLLSPALTVSLPLPTVWKGVGRGRGLGGPAPA
jgi:hypothetical protein